MDLLWRGSDTARARHGLRNSLWAINSALGKDVVAADGDFVGLSGQVECATDVDVFRTRVKSIEATQIFSPQNREAMIEIAALYRGDFLAGFSAGTDSTGFEEWRFQESESLRLDYARVLEMIVRSCGTFSEFETAIDYGRKWVDMDVLDERAHRSLMELYAWTGNRRAALRQYKLCEEILKKETQELPEETTRELYRAVKESRLKPPEQEHEERSHHVIDENAAFYGTALSVGLGGVSQPLTPQRPFDTASVVGIALERKMSRVLEKYSSHTMLTIGDNLLAVFGIRKPGEDDAYHAVLASIEILKLAESYGFWMAAGICSGLMYLVTATEKPHCRMSISGPAVDGAVGFRSIATPGAIVTGREIYSHTARSVAFTVMRSPGLEVPAYQFRVLDPDSPS